MVHMALKEGDAEGTEVLEVRIRMLSLRPALHAVVYRFYRRDVVPDPVSFGKRNGILFLRVEL